MILTVSSSGELVLPAELVPAEPNAQVEAERQGSSVRVKPITSNESFAKNSAAFWENFPTFPAGPVNSEITFRREELYDDSDRCG